MPLLKRRPTQLQTRLAKLAIKRLLVDASLTPELVAYAGYPQSSSVIAWRKIFPSINFLQELCLSAPKGFGLSASNDVRFVKRRLLCVSRGKPKR